MRKLLCFVRSSPSSPRTASMCSHLRLSAEGCFEAWPKKKLPLQEKLIKGRTAGTSLGLKKMYQFHFLGKKPRRTLNVCRRLHRLIETDFPWKAYCSLRTDTTSYSIDAVSYGSSGNKGLPALCSVLPPACSVGALCCNATRTALSVLSHTLYNDRPPLVNYLRHSADLPLYLVYPELSSVCCQTHFDVIHY